MSFTDEQIKKLSIAFQDIDFSQPKAHEVFRCMERALEKLMVHNATWREYYFFKLGRSANIKKWEFNHIAPLTVEAKEKKVEP